MTCEVIVPSRPRCRLRDVAEEMIEEGYDVIGDVHGHHAQLAGLLGRMGYTEERGAWRHPRRQAVFVGDLIDRGPGQVECYSLARSMVEAGTAHVVAGNHEYNAVAFHTRDPAEPDRFLRPHTEKNLAQHHEFLRQISDDVALHDEIIEWFRDLPLWFERDGLRVVHACWDPTAIDLLRASHGTDEVRLTDELLVASSRPGTPEWRAIEHLLKGPEIDLPHQYLDKGGHTRTRARFRWWDPAADRLDRAAVLPSQPVQPDGSAFPTLPPTPVDVPVNPYTDSVPVIYGHYWRTGQPAPSGPHTACVDYSAGAGGPLVAYRWSGEARLESARFVAQTPARF